jgi:hypothetical protein
MLGVGVFEAEEITGYATTIIILNHGQPRPGRLTILVQEPDVLSNYTRKCTTHLHPL